MGLGSGVSRDLEGKSAGWEVVRIFVLVKVF